MKRFRDVTPAVAVLCAMAWTGTAQAVTAGTYSGKAADGSPISFTVGTDGSGKLAVIGVSLNFTAKCKGTAPTSYNGGWGFGTDAEIKRGKASLNFSLNGGYVFTIPSMTFDFDTSPVSGKESIRTAILNTTTGKTLLSKAEYCSSPTQAFSATLNSAAPPLPALPPGAAIVMPTRQ